MKANKFLAFNRNTLSVVLLLLLLGRLSSAATENVLVKFKDGPNGKYPNSSLIFDDQGNLYGSASEGGTGNCTGIDGPQSNCGVVFKLTPFGSGWTETVLYSFKGGADGFSPNLGMVFDAAGNLYGITNSDVFGSPGSNNCGEVFKLTPTPVGEWSKTTLHNFAGGQDGCLPSSTPVLDKAGNVYGVTEFGGAATTKNCINISRKSGCGIVYQLTPKQGGGWSERILHRFQDLQDGGLPASGDLAFDSSGRLWGTTAYGGNLAACTGTGGCGVLFYLALGKNGQWTRTVVHTFAGGTADGRQPQAVTVDPAGNVFVTAAVGTTTANGGLFEFSPKAGGGFSESPITPILLNGGSGLPAHVIIDPSGNLFGIVPFGNRFCACGDVYEMSPNGNGTWTQTILYKFKGKGDGLWPLGDALVRDSSGNLYGTALRGGNVAGGDQGDGAVFKITP
jgi:hypothetical protein